ncbi:unnamed protein product, partial [Rotaria magnacalcarata]
MTTNSTNSYNQEDEQQQQQIIVKSSYHMEMEEQNLSEKMRHLSTTATHEKHPIKILKEIRDQLEIIPNYLTKQNISFKKSMHQVLSSMITAATTENSNKNVNSIDELRKIAILLYKIMVIQTYQYLWETYFK